MNFHKTLRGIDFEFETKPGLFSKEHIDPGTELLINTMEIKNGNTVIDLGCGYGPIGLTSAKLSPKGKVYMVDADIRAIKYSKINAKFNNITNVEILASDGFEEIPKDIQFDVVVSNPPSHMPQETVREFMEDAKKRLKKGGKLYFVTERRIKPMIKREFERIFGNYDTIATTAIYAVSVAVKE